MPPWERGRMPLVESADGELLAAGDRVLAATLQAWLQDRCARIVWTSESSPDPHGEAG